MAVLSGSSRENFEAAVRKFARETMIAIVNGRYTGPEAEEKFIAALLKAAKRGAEHPDWYVEKV
jgi:hypothetical protein